MSDLVWLKTIVDSLDLEDSEEDLTTYQLARETTRFNLRSFGVPEFVCDKLTDEVMLLGRIVGNRQADKRDLKYHLKHIDRLSEMVAQINLEENRQTFEDSN